MGLFGKKQDDGQDNDHQEKKREHKPLDQNQIEYAKTIINDLHPINNTPYQVSFPFTKIFGSLIPQAEQYDPQENQDPENQTLLNEDEKSERKGHQKKVMKTKKKAKMSLSEVETKNDPILLLGYGIVAYRNLLKTLTFLYLGLSILVTPVIMLYQQGDGFNGYNAVTSYDLMTIGNLGQSSVQCNVNALEASSVSVSCGFGVLGEMTNIGLNSANDAHDNCLASTDSTCASAFDDSYFQQIYSSCLEEGASTCTFDLTDDNLYYDVNSAPSECVGEAYIFVQYQCVQTDEMLIEKYDSMSWVVAIFIFISLTYYLTLNWISSYGKILQLQWDISTITASDYTVEMPIKPEAYKKWHEEMYSVQDKHRDIAPGVSLRHYLTQNIQSILSDQHKNRHQDDEDYKVPNTEVADIVFAYNNQELILLLRERGQAIGYNQFDKVREIEKQINELKNSKYRELTEPVCAFITFESDDGYNEAIRFDKSPGLLSWMTSAHSDIEIMYQPLILKPAVEPTNILWENRHFTKPQQKWRSFQSLLMCSAILVTTFLGISYSEQQAIQYAEAWPDMDCDSIVTSYGDYLQEFAYIEYETIASNPDAGKLGALQCFCDLQETNGASQDALYNNPEDLDTSDQPICSEYFWELDKIEVLESFVSYGITLINYVVRTIVIMIIVWQGKPTESEQLQLITQAVYICQFFNSGLLLLLCNANLSEQSAFLGQIANGSTYDLDINFYHNIGGTLVASMIFNMYFPLIEVFGYWGMRVMYRWLDSGRFWNFETTKKTSIQQYIDVYSGEEYYMHYKYSSILNITFVTFMYGAGIPILFPVAFVSLLVLFLVEKTCLFYVYKQPPMYDEKLNNSVVYALTYVPYFFLGSAFWMVSNNQLWNENLSNISKSQEVMVSGHIWSDSFKMDTFKSIAGPLIITFFLILVSDIIQPLISHIFGTLCSCFKHKDMHIDEDIDLYFNCLDDEDKHWSIKEAENAKFSLKMDLFDQDFIMKVSKARQGKNSLKGVHSYDILANPLYFDDFQYFSAAMEDRQDYIVDDDSDEGNDCAQSDLVRFVLNLAFLPEDRAMAFSFDKHGLTA